jgi:HEAT repeat protein
MKAISELAGFSFDDKVREEMEKILLSDPDPELRKEAAKAFGKVVNEKALAVLEKARVSDPDIAVRQEADNSIKQIKSN